MIVTGVSARKILLAPSPARICTQTAYAHAMARIDEIWDAPVGTPEGDELEAIVERVVEV